MRSLSTFTATYLMLKEGEATQTWPPLLHGDVSGSNN